MAGEIKVIRETRLDPGFPLSRRELMELTAIVLEMLGLEESSVTVKLVDDKEITRLNEKFMGCTGPTNVLSFPANGSSHECSPEVPVYDEAADSDDSGFLGELALSVDALSREAELYGQDPAGHLTRLLAHGILHLAGYDHGDEMYDLTDAAVDRVLLEEAARNQED